MKKEHVSLISVLFITLRLLLSSLSDPLSFSGIHLLGRRPGDGFLSPFPKTPTSHLKTEEFLSAMIMTLLVILVIVIPFTRSVISLANEVIGAYQSVEEMIETGRLQAYPGEGSERSRSSKRSGPDWINPSASLKRNRSTSS